MFSFFNTSLLLQSFISSNPNVSAGFPGGKNTGGCSCPESNFSETDEMITEYLYYDNLPYQVPF